MLAQLLVRLVVADLRANQEDALTDPAFLATFWPAEAAFFARLPQNAPNSARFQRPTVLSAGSVNVGFTSFRFDQS